MGCVNPEEGNEVLMTEGGKVVAATATFNEDWTIVPLEKDMWPKK